MTFDQVLSPYTGARYLWTREQLAEAGALCAAGVRTDVPAVPCWTKASPHLFASFWSDSGCAQSCVPSGNRSLCFDSIEADSG